MILCITGQWKGECNNLEDLIKFIALFFFLPSLSPPACQQQSIPGKRAKTKTTNISPGVSPSGKSKRKPPTWCSHFLEMVCYWTRGSRPATNGEVCFQLPWDLAETTLVCNAIKFGNCRSRPKPYKLYPSSIPRNDHPYPEYEARILTILLIARIQAHHHPSYSFKFSNLYHSKRKSWLKVINLISVNRRHSPDYSPMESIEY